MKPAEQLTPEQQTAILAERYTLRAEAYDTFWSPVILPLGERLLAHLPLAGTRSVIDVGTGAGALLPLIRRAAPEATVLGVDRSEGMLRLARQRHAGPLALMDAQELELPSEGFDLAVVAFVLFHLPSPERCLREVHRVLRKGGVVGTATWGFESPPPANSIWDEELTAAGAHPVELPATDQRGCCDSQEKMASLLERAGFTPREIWTESLEHRWQPEAHFEYHVRSTSLARLQSLSGERREACLRRVRGRLASPAEEMYVFRGEVVMATGFRWARSG